MTLNDLITALEAQDPDRVLPLGFHSPHSSRWDYSELAFEPAVDVRVGDMLADARSAVDATYEGYKGGIYRMRLSTECHLADWGDVGESLGSRFLGLMLAAGHLTGPARDQARALARSTRER